MPLSAARRPQMDHLEHRTLFAVLPTGYVDTLVTAGLEQPISVDFAPDGRAFVTEQRGRVRVIKDGRLLPEPFVTLDVSSSGERGALGIELDPDFASNGYVYVFHTAKTPYLHNRVSRFTAMGDVAAPGSEQVIFDLDKLESGSLIHNGGDLKFGPDGKLYLSAGENGKSGNAQLLNTTLGKLLRINADGSIPADNPFFSQTTGNNRAIYALGFRNPYTFDISPAGKIYVNDVGEATWEEVNDVAAGGNYGWPKVQGPNTANTDPTYLGPLFAYRHGSRAAGIDKTDEPLGAAISGGTFYDAPPDAAHPFPTDLADDYFFVDGTNQWIWRLDPATGQQQRFAGHIGPAVDVEVAPDGTLWYTAWGLGELRKITAEDVDTAPQITLQPSSQSVAIEQPANFSVEAVGRAPLSYQWRRGGVPIEAATQPTYTVVPTTVDQGATFDCVVTNELGSVTSSAATLTVIVDAPPAPVILTPKEGKLYKGGQTLSFKGSATDAEDGKLPASAYSWRVDFHHDEHLHPFYPETAGKKSGMAKIPRVGETSSNVWYRIHLTVTDSQGVTATTFRDVFPQKVTITVNAPAGAEIYLNGETLKAPFSFVGVVGIARQLSASPTATVGDMDVGFIRWNGSRYWVLDFVTPAKNKTYVATYGSTVYT
jgi:glucose/arabinose dehydrogenase